METGGKLSISILNNVHKIYPDTKKIKLYICSVLIMCL